MPENCADFAIAWSVLKKDEAFAELRAVLRRGLYESDPLPLKALQEHVGGDKDSVRRTIDDALNSFGEGPQRTAARRLFRATDDTRHLRGLDRARLEAVDALNDDHITTAGALRRAPVADEDAGGWEWQVLRAVWKYIASGATKTPAGTPTGSSKHGAYGAGSGAPSSTTSEPGHVPGRDDDLASVVDDISGGRSVVIRGAPGLGKTTLLQAARAAFPDCTFVRLEQGGDAMRDLRLALHRRTGGDFPVDDDQGISLISRAFPDGALVFVDNADEPESAEAIRRLSGHVPALIFAVTSRAQSFPGFQVRDLPPLSRTAAEELLTDFDLSPSSRDAVLSRAAGNPLLLKQEAWAAVEGSVMEDEDRLRGVLSRFDDRERRVLWLIGEMPSAVLPRGLVTNVGGLKQRGLGLLRRNAVAIPAGDGYEFHETLRVACRDVCATVPEKEIRELREDAARFYIEWLGADPSLSDVDRALSDLLHLLESAPDAATRVDLALALIGDRLDDPVGYIPSRGLSGLLREKLGPLRAAATKVGGVKAAQLEKNLGLFCHWADDPAAEELVLSARSRFRDADDAEGRAGAIWILGIIADDSCDYVRAEALYGEPLAWLHDPDARAVAHHLTGCSLYHQGRYEEARNAFTKALATTDDSVMRSRSTRRLSYVELVAGDAERAISGLEESLGRAAALNRPRDVARIQRHIGEAHLRLDRADAADKHFSTAREIFEQVGDKRGLGATLLGLAATRRRQTRLIDAAKFAALSKQIASGADQRLLGRVVSPVGVARAEEEEARIVAAAGDSEDAVKHLRRACNVYEIIGHARCEALAAELGSERDAALPQPQGIVFDLIDTLAETSHIAYEEAKLHISSTLGVDHDRFKAAWARSRRQASLDASWTPRNRIEWVAQELGVSPPDSALDELADAERALWTSGVDLKPGAADVLKRIKAAGIKIALVSNGTSAMRGLAEILNLESVLTATVVSSAVGAMKPNPEIYLRALELLGVTADQAMYVGDGSDRELEGAQAVGLFAVRMQSGPKPKYNTKHSLNWDATVHSLEELADKLGV
jgi:putative hydrolase of the HAD superfamily